MKRLSIPIILLFLIAFKAQAQPPFYEDIQKFLKEDSAHFPKAGQYLFVGSSSFTNWTDVQDYFPGYPIINRGFGGSALPDLIRYASQVIFPYHPKQIIIYCGENDFAENDTVSVQTVVSRFKELYRLIRSQLADVPIGYISMKPSPSRKHLMPKFEAANNQIKDFLAKEKNSDFIDVYHSMLKPDGQPMAEIFREDELHMNSSGYKIWQKIIQPYLKKN